MRVVVTGSSGLIGSALVPALEAEGHEVIKLVRRSPIGSGEAEWDPEAGTIDTAGLAGVDGAVHLAGEGIGERRWTANQKRRIVESRVKGTTLLARSLAELEPRPRVLVSASAIGFYGLRGDEVLTEESAGGTGFLADLVRQWEAATAPAEAAEIRTVHLRTGIVLSPNGGALAKMLPLFRLGLGGRLGRGDQWWSWVSIRDVVGLTLRALTDDSLRGPVNATGPKPATNAEITKVVGQILGRPTLLPVPKFALSLVMGRELAQEVILAGQRVLPKAAESVGYQFAHPDLGSALRAALAK
jgi:uncharacterized protein (TIGR01777 family)